MAKLTEAEKRKNFEKTVGSSENDMGPLPELKPKQYSPKDISSKTPASSRNGIGPMGIPAPKKTPEPTFKSDVDNMVSGVKKFNDKVNDTTRPVRKILEKAAGKEEQGIIGQFTKPNEYSKDNKAKGIDLKVKSIDVKDKVIPMTKEDKEVLNSPEFKRASEATMDKKKGGMIKASASSRADGCAVRGKTRA